MFLVLVLLVFVFLVLLILMLLFIVALLMLFLLMLILMVMLPSILNMFPGQGGGLPLLQVHPSSPLSSLSQLGCHVVLHSCLNNIYL